MEVKANAPELLEQELRWKRKPCMVGTGAMSDPYMHIEEQLGLTRQCLEVIKNNHCGVAVQTKSNRILRDGDRQYYYANLDRHFPGLKERYIRHYGNAYELPSENREKLSQIFHELCDTYGIETNSKKIFNYMHTYESKLDGEQLSLF